MGKRKFSDLERFALWSVYEHKCFYCGKPIPFDETSIDHVVPEVYLERAKEWKETQTEYALDDSFKIDSVFNWVPAHQSRCNRRKGETLLARNQLLLLLEQVRKAAPYVIEQLEALKDERSRGKVLGRVKAALSAGVISSGDVIDIMRPTGKDSDDPLVFTLGLNFAEPLTPLPSELPGSYPHACDWLERDLTRLLSMTGEDFEVVEDARNGETFSLRVKLDGVSWRRVDALKELLGRIEHNAHWWELLEVRRYREVYEE
jgi:hypothetical protein